MNDTKSPKAVTTGVWFQVELRAGSEVAKANKLATHIYYWAYRREDDTYDIFGNSQHGPYITRVSGEAMKGSARAVRNKLGILRTARPEEVTDLDRNLNWYLSK